MASRASRARTSSAGTFLSSTLVSDAPTVKQPLNPRKLIVCIDGTSNQYSEKNTNVIELYSHIEKSDTQLTYYNSGIGTYAKPSWRSFSYLKQVVSNGIDLAIAWNLERVIIGAYRWLSDNYRPGDQIFLFGFSRGAYQVRAIAGMIATVGLIFPGNQEQIPFAFELYADYLGDSPDELTNNPLSDTHAKLREAIKQSKQKVDIFRKTFSRPSVEVHFLGAWDTVSSIGFRRGKLLPLTNKCDHIKHFRHALALDERRVKFLPEHVEYPHYGHVDDNHIKEVWFAGTHSDVGGGNTRNLDLNRGTEPLVWMMNEAEEAGLVIDSKNLGDGVKRASVIPSLTGGWWLLEVLPLNRLSYTSQATSRERVISQPHLGHGRKILKHHKIHYSVLANHLQSENGNGYEPRASCKIRGSKVEWKKVFSDAQQSREQQIQWEGDYKIVDVLKIVREAEAKLAQPDAPEISQWLRLVHGIAVDDVSSKMIWEYGGVQFLLKLAQLEDNSRLVPEIIRMVIGVNGNRRPESPISPTRRRYTLTEAALQINKQVVPFPLFPPDDPERRRKIIEEAIPRLPDLLTCYKRSSKNIKISSPEAPEGYRPPVFSRAIGTIHREKTKLQARVSKFVDRKLVASQSERPLRSPRKRATTDTTRSIRGALNSPATLRLVEIALNLMSELAERGFARDMTQADVIHHLVLLLTHQSLLVEPVVSLMLNVLDVITKLATGDELGASIRTDELTLKADSARTRFYQKHTVPKIVVVLRSKQNEMTIAALRALTSLADDHRNARYFTGAEFTKALVECLSPDKSRELLDQAIDTIAVISTDAKVATRLAEMETPSRILQVFYRLESSGQKMRAVQALRILSGSDTARSQLFEHNALFTLQPLVDKSPDVIHIIESLAHHSRARQQMIDKGMLANVIALVTNPNVSISRRAMHAVAAFATYKEVRRQIIEHQAINKIVSFIRKPNLMADALDVIARIAFYADLHGVLAETEVVEELMKALKQQKKQTEISAANSNQRLTGSTIVPQYGNSRAENFIISRIVGAFTELLVDSGFRQQMIQHKLVNELLNLDPAASHIASRDIMTYVEAEDTKMAEAVLRFLERLAAYDDSRSDLVNNSRAIYLLGWLIDPLYSPQHLVCLAISSILAIAQHDDSLAKLVTHITSGDGLARVIESSEPYLTHDARDIYRLFTSQVEAKERMEQYLRRFSIIFGTTQESLVGTVQSEPDGASTFEQIGIPSRFAINGRPLYAGSDFSIASSSYDTATSSLGDS